MEFPKDEKIRFKLLEFAKDGHIHSIQDAEDYLAKEFKITEEQRRKEKRTGHETLFLHKIRWCRTHLRIADLISDPKKAYYQITALGKKFLEDNSDLKEITTQTLMKYKKFQAWKNENDELKKKKKSSKKAKEGNGVVIMIDALGTSKLCTKHFLEVIRDNTQGETIQMILPIENSQDKCENLECIETCKKIIHYTGELIAYTLPPRKDIIIQMFKEIQLAIESGCVIEFSGEDKYRPGLPNMTLYKFLINKELLVKSINLNENGK